MLLLSFVWQQQQQQLVQPHQRRQLGKGTVAAIAAPEDHFCSLCHYDWIRWGNKAVTSAEQMHAAGIHRQQRQ